MHNSHFIGKFPTGPKYKNNHELIPYSVVGSHYYHLIQKDKKHIGKNSKSSCVINLDSIKNQQIEESKSKRSKRSSISSMHVNKNQLSQMTQYSNNYPNFKQKAIPLTIHPINVYEEVESPISNSPTGTQRMKQTCPSPLFKSNSKFTRNHITPLQTDYSTSPSIYTANTLNTFNTLKPTNSLYNANNNQKNSDNSSKKILRLDLISDEQLKKYYESKKIKVKKNDVS